MSNMLLQQPLARAWGYCCCCCCAAAVLLRCCAPMLPLLPLPLCAVRCCCGCCCALLLGEATRGCGAQLRHAVAVHGYETTGDASVASKHRRAAGLKRGGRELSLLDACHAAQPPIVVIGRFFEDAIVSM